MSRIIFTKYLPPVRSKFVTKLKVCRVYWNLAHLIFQLCGSQFWYGSSVHFYFLLGPHLIGVIIELFDFWSFWVSKLSRKYYYSLPIVPALIRFYFFFFYSNNRSSNSVLTTGGEELCCPSSISRIVKAKILYFVAKVSYFAQIFLI